MILRVEGIGPLKGGLKVPGDKSISHRSLISASIAEGYSEISGLSSGQDVLSTLSCLRQLGIGIAIDGNNCRVEGRGLKGFIEPDDVLDAGNSGTTLRMLPGLLSGQSFLTTMTGDSSLRKRPMGRIIEPLSLMGAKIWARDGNRLAPMSIKGTQLSPMEYELPVASAQVKSAIIYAGLMAEGVTEIIEPSQSRDHTERQLEFLGADISIDVVGGKRHIKVVGGSTFTGGLFEVPADISSAAFFMVAATLVPGSKVVLEDVGLNETRTGILEVLKSMGAFIVTDNVRVVGKEEIGRITVNSSPLLPVTVRGETIPKVIDEIPILAVAATQATGVTGIRNASELRVKESDRIAALARELTKMGAVIEELPDGMIIRGPSKLHGAKVNSHGDHRIAMALAVAALVAEGVTEISDAECVSISYPSFAQDLASLGGTA